MFNLGLIFAATLLLQPPARAQLSPDAILERVESARLEIRSGRVHLAYEDAVDSKFRYRGRLLAEFYGTDMYAMELREHNALPAQPPERAQCIQVFDGAKVMGMLRGPAQKFYICTERAARYQLFNPLWLGLFYFPLPGLATHDVLFWRDGAKLRHLGSDNGLHEVEVDRTAADGTRSVTQISVDPERGWNVVRIRARVGNTHEVEVDSELGLFGGRWFPIHVTMRQTGPAGGVVEAEITVLDAALNLPLEACAFSLARLGQPDAGVADLVLDERSGYSLRFGFWDGQVLRPKR